MSGENWVGIMKVMVVFLSYFSFGINSYIQWTLFGISHLWVKRLSIMMFLPYFFLGLNSYSHCTHFHGFHQPSITSTSVTTVLSCASLLRWRHSVTSKLLLIWSSSFLVFWLCDRVLLITCLASQSQRSIQPSPEHQYHQSSPCMNSDLPRVSDRHHQSSDPIPSIQVRNHTRTSSSRACRKTWQIISWRLYISVSW